MAEIRINVLDPADAGGLDRCYAIYREAILKSEQRPEADFKALFERTDYRFVVARMDEQIVGVAVSWAPAQADFWLFEYAAVSPEVRGMQIGSHLLKASMAIIGLQRVALIEVDADMGSDEQARRLRFYQRLGARRLRGLGRQHFDGADIVANLAELRVDTRQLIHMRTCFHFEDHARALAPERYDVRLHLVHVPCHNSETQCLT